MTSLRARTAAVFALLLAGSVVAGACILVDPPADIPTPNPHRPVIIHGSVVPPPSQILTTWPANSEFDVPVELIDPSQDFEWQDFIDDDINNHGQIKADPADPDAGVRWIFARLTEPTGGGCHVISVMVAATFSANRTPDELGADSVEWFYAPSGDLTTCPVFDAGPIVADGGFLDANASDGGT